MRLIILSGLVLSICAGFSIKSHAQTSSVKLPPGSSSDIGVAVSSPLPISLTFREILSERRSVMVGLGPEGVQAQLNFTGDSHLGSYWLLGAGRTKDITLIKAGYGYKWQPGRFSFYLETSLNAPIWYRQRDGFGNLDYLTYLIPLAFGVHYRLD